MKYLMLLVAGLAWIHASATPDTAWHNELALMNQQMQSVQYESYQYEATTVAPGDSTFTQRGTFYLNRPDTLLYHVVGPVTMVFTRDQFLRCDDEHRVVMTSSFTGPNTRKRNALLGTFFNVGEALSLLNGMLNNAKLVELRHDADKTMIRLEISDGRSYTNQATIALDPSTHLLQYVKYDVVRHTDFKNPTPATDYRQIVRCSNYGWTRNAATESNLKSAAQTIQQRMSSGTYKINQL